MVQFWSFLFQMISTPVTCHHKHESLTRVIISHDNIEDRAPVVPLSLGHGAVNHGAPATSDLMRATMMIMKTIKVKYILVLSPKWNIKTYSKEKVSIIKVVLLIKKNGRIRSTFDIEKWHWNAKIGEKRKLIWKKTFSDKKVQFTIQISFDVEVTEKFLNGI